MSNNEEVKPQEVKIAPTPLVQPQGQQQGQGGRRFEKNRSKVRSRRDNKSKDDRQEKKQFEHKIITIRRVTKMYKGGRRMKLSVFVVVGDKKGRVGLGLGKGEDVKTAQEKAISQAKKNLIMVPLKGNTIPHEILMKYKSSRVLLKPAAPGTGIVAGSSVRMVAEVAGINDLLGKILGANNKITNAYAAVQALGLLRQTRL
jgi:small subunit ribosomal protein S5